MSKKIILAGGSGFLGNSLGEFLIDKGYEVVVLTRGTYTYNDGIKYVHWDGATLGKWADEVDGSTAVVNFTGKSVNCIYTKANKEEILWSRLHSVRVLKEAIKHSAKPPQAFIQAGSLAIFGDTTQVCDESSELGNGFSVNVCKEWEEEFFKEALPNTRQVLLRIGFALGKAGGALEPLKKLAQYNLGGTVGSGRQYISWIHIDDLNEIFQMVIENPKLSGVYNATGPQAINNKDFMSTLRTVMGKGWAPPAPAPFVWLGAYLVLKTEPSLALTGRNCIPKRLIESGFEFKFIDLMSALSDLIKKEEVLSK